MSWQWPRSLHYLHLVRTVICFCHNSKNCRNRNSKQMTRSVLTICTWCESQFLVAVIPSYLSLRSWLNNVSRHFKLRWYLLYGKVSKQRTRQSLFSSFTLLHLLPSSFQHVNELKYLAHPLDLEPSVYILSHNFTPVVARAKCYNQTWSGAEHLNSCWLSHWLVGWGN